MRRSKDDGNFSIDETGVYEVDTLAKAMVEANKAVLDAKTRLSRIIELFEVPIGAFEIKTDSDKVLQQMPL